MHHWQFNARHLAGWALAIATLASACGGKVDETSHAASAVADCNSFCNKMLVPKCPSDNLTQCLADCKALPTSTCSELHAQFLQCAVERAKYLCSGEHAQMQGCDTEMQNYLTCINAGPQDSGVKD